MRQITRAMALCACLVTGSASLRSAVYTPAADGTVALVSIAEDFSILDISVGGLSTGDVDGLGTITLAEAAGPPNSVLFAVQDIDAVIFAFNTDPSAVVFGTIDNETLTILGTGSAATPGAETIGALSALLGAVTANFLHTDEFIPNADGGGTLIYRLTSLQSGSSASAATPEPGTVSIVALGMMAVGLRRFRRLGN